MLKTLIIFKIPSLARGVSEDESTIMGGILEGFRGLGRATGGLRATMPAVAPVLRISGGVRGMPRSSSTFAAL